MAINSSSSNGSCSSSEAVALLMMMICRWLLRNYSLTVGDCVCVRCTSMNMASSWRPVPLRLCSPQYSTTDGFSRTTSTTSLVALTTKVAADFDVLDELLVQNCCVARRQWWHDLLDVILSDWQLRTATLSAVLCHSPRILASSTDTSWLVLLQEVAPCGLRGRK